MDQSAMNTIIKRYFFKSGLDIIAPRKCGTRWLESLCLDIENHINTDEIHKNLDKHIHSGTIFIWRPVREHMLSALKTELSLHSEKTPFDVVTEMESGVCDHWYPYLYKELYPIWANTPFRFHKLQALSELTSSHSPLTITYKFDLPDRWDSIESILSSLSPEHVVRLERLINEEERWLKLMVEPQYEGKGWEAYSDLEDSFLEMKRKAIDLEAEMEHRVMDLEAEMARITDGFQTTIKELQKSNSRLEFKIEYAESLLGKKAIKII
jgi:hypothetical protein